MIRIERVGNPPPPSMWVLQNSQDLQAPMLSGSEEDPSPRRPFEFIANIFKRRRDPDADEDDDNATATNSTTSPPNIAVQGPEGGASGAVTSPEMMVSSSSEVVTSSAEGGATAHHTPVKSRDIGIDMEAIRLSRQDNPYLQRVADTQTTLNEEEEESARITSAEDRAQLVSQSQEDVLSLSEVHEHLIRSPPPTSLPKTLAKNVFVFPVPKTSEGISATQVEGTPHSHQSLKPLVTRQHEDVLDHHLRQILHTQRQLVVSREQSGEAVCMSSCSMPGSPAHSRGLSRRSPHARTLSEEATVVQSLGSSSAAGGTMTGVTTMTTSLAPLLPPGRRQVSSSDLLLNPANPPTGTATPTPPMLKPISSKPKRSTGGPEAGLASSSSLRLPIRYPHQPATSSPLIDIT